MKTIYKYPIEVCDSQVVKMPKGAQILSIQFQGQFPGLVGGQLCIWALVDTSNEVEDRHFSVFGTGHIIYPLVDTFSHRQHISTVQSGSFVWHIFENFVRRDWDISSQKGL